MSTRHIGSLDAYLAAIVDSSNDAIIGKDLDGIITTWNRGAENLFGYTAQEAVGQHISLLAVPSVADEMPTILNRLRRGESISQHETVRRHKDGREVSISLTISPIQDPQGRIIGACKIARDITERKRAEDRFRLVVEAAPNAMVMIGDDGIIVLINSQTENLFGYSRGELVGRPVELLVPTRLRLSHGEHRRGFFHTPVARAMGVGRDLFGLRKDGAEIPIEIGLNPMNSSGRNFVLASIIDITERKLAENNLKRSLNEKTALLQEVHHRVKNNLYIISSLLSMQANTIEDQDTVAKLHDSERRVLSMAMIHEQLYQHEDMSAVDLAQYVGHLATQLFSSYAAGGLVTYRLDVTPTSLTMEQSIPCGLILNELITNALKYAYPAGRGEVSICVHAKGDLISMTVSDNGPGMPPDFDLKKAKSLGMKIISLLTTQLGGRLEIGAPPGASFTITFPKQALTTAHQSHATA